MISKQNRITQEKIIYIIFVISFNLLFQFWNKIKILLTSLLINIMYFLFKNIPNTYKYVEMWINKQFITF